MFWINDDSYCADCYKRKSCEWACDNYLEFLSVIGECLNGHSYGIDPCDCCQNKGWFDCPLFGADAVGFEVFGGCNART